MQNPPSTFWSTTCDMGRAGRRAALMIAVPRLCRFVVLLQSEQKRQPIVSALVRRL